MTKFFENQNCLLLHNCFVGENNFSNFAFVMSPSIFLIYDIYFLYLYIVDSEGRSFELTILD